MAPALPKPPTCPPWCHKSHPAGGWTVDVGGAYKRCERHVMVDTDMDYTLERFAEVTERGTVEVGEPFLRFMGIEMPLSAAVKCCRYVLELAEMAGGDNRVDDGLPVAV